MLAKSQQIRCLGVMALAQGLTTNLVDIVWKTHLHMLHPDPARYAVRSCYRAQGVRASQAGGGWHLLQRHIRGLAGFRGVIVGGLGLRLSGLWDPTAGMWPAQ